MTTKQVTSEKSCNHEWYMVRDWEGDPGVVNGVYHFYFYRCALCGEEVDDLPQGEGEVNNDPDPDPDDSICGQWYDGN